ncbi:M15 family metallopeptidase [Limisalsivibrio acetivorans]|uniref:M15 family metallopeptidase n=1 Tax=Limisalsivibrio acetivorans TaxID=1304888 RepID=UPI0003B6FB73|nr:M15 family metallopeptidase [Limisalsivibrio acetivorans]
MGIIRVLFIIALAHIVFAAELPEGFVYLNDRAPTIIKDIRYHTSHNFIGTPVDGYEEPECILTAEAADALAVFQQELLEKGFSLKVYDCYRPQRAVDHFVRWAKDTGDTLTKGEFYLHEDKSTLFERGYIASRSGHSRGSTVDLTIIPADMPSQEEYIPHIDLRDCIEDNRYGDNSIDMGTGFDCFHELSSTLHPAITGKAAENRSMLLEGMQRHGFKNYSREWWHYTLKNEPFGDTYFDFPVK